MNKPRFQLKPAYMVQLGDVVAVKTPYGWLKNEVRSITRGFPTKSAPTGSVRIELNDGGLELHPDYNPDYSPEWCKFRPSKYVTPEFDPLRLVLVEVKP